LDLTVFAGDRLVAATNVNNAEASDRQPNTITNKKPAFIWAAMPNRIGHELEGAPYFSARHRRINDACYSTHIAS
jgi:hypothetical protein